MNQYQAISDRIRELVRDVPDFPKPGIVFKDLTTVFENGPALRDLCVAFADRYRDKNIDAIVGIESRGFIVGTPIAVEMQKGFVVVRKPGKLPWRTRSKTYELEYGKDTLEMHEDALKPGMRVVIVDDLLATGGTMEATCSLVRESGATVVEAAFVVELGFLKGRERLKDVECFSLVTY